VKNHRPARSILDMGWFELFRQLEYKALASGSLVIKADRFFPNMKLCMNCGQLHDMPLNKRTFKCDCGCEEMDRDLHSAQNLEANAVSFTV
jgi:putative transposase